MAKQKQVKKNAPVIENSPKAVAAPLQLPATSGNRKGWKVAVLIILVLFYTIKPLITAMCWMIPL